MNQDKRRIVPGLIRHNLAAYWPLWALYSFVLSVIYVIMLNDRGADGVLFLDGFIFADSTVAYVQFWFVFVAAICLFRYLDDARLVNAMHAMPLRRESWFLTQAVSCLLMIMIPNLVFSAVALPMLGEKKIVILFWIGCMLISFLFSLGISVLLMMITARSYAAVICLCIVHVLPFFLNALAETIVEFMPMGSTIRSYYAIIPDFSPFSYLISGMERYDEIERYAVFGDGGSGTLMRNITFVLILLAVGIAALIISVILYKRRKTESAGDFLAFPKLRYAMIPAISLTIGTIIYILLGESFAVLVIGMVLGYYPALMIVDRKLRVLSKKTGAGWFAWTGAVAAVLAVCAVAVPAAASHVPDAERIAYAEMHYSAYMGDRSTAARGKITEIDIRLEKPGQIQDLAALHETVLNHQEMWIEQDKPDGQLCQDLDVIYHMNDGRIIARTYSIAGSADPAENPISQAIKPFAGNHELLLAYPSANHKGGDSFRGLYLLDESGEMISYSISGEAWRGLISAAARDMAAGNLSVLNSSQTHGVLGSFEYDRYYDDDGKFVNNYLMTKVIFTADCENIAAWLDANGDKLQKSIK